MRHDIVIGLGLTIVSMLSLISYHAGMSMPAAGTSSGYALAISTGSGFRLASPDAKPAVGPVGLTSGAPSRVLSCEGVMRLGVVDVGYSCSAPVAKLETGSL